MRRGAEQGVMQRRQLGLGEGLDRRHRPMTCRKWTPMVKRDSRHALRNASIGLKREAITAG
jgi:hypothetical protein